jgi:hypothetical protein
VRERERNSPRSRAVKGTLEPRGHGTLDGEGDRVENLGAVVVTGSVGPGTVVHWCVCCCCHLVFGGYLVFFVGAGDGGE